MRNALAFLPVSKFARTEHCSKAQTMRVVRTLVAGTLVLICPSIVVGSGPDSLWTRTFGNIWDDWCEYVQQTADGGYVMAGSCQLSGGDADFWLVKTDGNGNHVWDRAHGGAYYDYCHAAQQTADGGYIMAGITNSFGPGAPGYYYVWLVKTDGAGNMPWSKIFGGTYGGSGNAVQQTADGGYILAGSISLMGASGLQSDFYLVKTDGAGNEVWSRSYGGQYGDVCLSVQQTADGGYILAGETSSFGAGNSDFWLVKTDAGGIATWSRTFGGSGQDQCHSVRQAADGGYILAGVTFSFGAGDADAWLVKTDGAGNLVWSRTFGGTSLDLAYCVRQLSSGNYVFTGWTGSFPGGDWYYTDFWLVNVNPDGSEAWSRHYGGSGRDCCKSVGATSDGSFILGGETLSFGAGNDDYWLVKTCRDFDLSGALSGVMCPGTYHVRGNIWVNAGSVLTIMPPATLIFDGPFSFEINGTLLAEGSEADSIIFTADPAQNPNLWLGLRFLGNLCSNSRLSYCRIDNGRANQGGGIFCDDMSAMVFSHCLITRCEADQGGGAYIDFKAHPLFSWCTIIINRAVQAPGQGGGVYVFPHSYPTFEHCDISRNEALTDGGGVYSWDASDTLKVCTVIDNYAGDQGGGQYVLNDEAVFDSACVIYSNYAGGDGGGVYEELGMGITFVDCVVSENLSSSRGAGVCCIYSEPEFTNCIINHNYAEGPGGGIYCDHSAPTFVHCALTRNLWDGAYCAEGCYFGFRSSIIAFSVGPGIHFCPACDIGNSYVRYCDLYGNSGGPFSGNVPAGLGVISGQNANGDPCDDYFNIFLNPMFVDTVAADFHLADGSPCIDAGDPGPPPPPSPDMDGYPRPGVPGTDPDIGPYEVHIDAGVAKVADSEDQGVIDCYPSVFRLETGITYRLPVAQRVSLCVYDARGRLVRRLLDQERPAGAHAAAWDGRDSAAKEVPPGVYFIRFEADARAHTRKVVLLR